MPDRTWDRTLIATAVMVALIAFVSIGLTVSAAPDALALAITLFTRLSILWLWVVIGLGFAFRLRLLSPYEKMRATPEP